MLIDSTLREGAQAYGVSFSSFVEGQILELISAAGVEEMEIGWVGKQGLEEVIAQSHRLPSRPALSLWSRLKSEDIHQAANLGISRINIGVPASGLHQIQRLGFTAEQVRDSIRKHIRLARDLGLGTVCLGLEDASRAEPEHLEQIVQAAVEAGADRIRLSDTVGILDPGSTVSLIRRAASIFPGPIAIHCHNDFGMGTANAIAALDNGADWADVSVLGLGERCGIARLEEVAAFLALGRRHRGYDLSTIHHLCRVVEQLAEIVVPGNKPVCGRDIFAAESGLHVHGLLINPTLFEPFDPKQIGVNPEKRRLSFGEKSGRAAIRSALLRFRPDWADDDEMVQQAAYLVKTHARGLGRPLSEKELAATLREIQGRQ